MISSPKEKTGLRASKEKEATVASKETTSNGTNSNGHAAVMHAHQPAPETPAAASSPAQRPPAAAAPAVRADGLFATGSRSARERLADCRVIRRNGEVVAFDDGKIFNAVMKAFAASSDQAAESERDEAVREEVSKVCDLVCRHLCDQMQSTTFQIEQIQDQVELALMRSEHFAIAKAFMLYRRDRQQKRQQRAGELMPNQFTVVQPDGSKILLDPLLLHERIEAACNGLSSRIDRELLFGRISGAMYEGIPSRKLNNLMVLEASTLCETEPDYLFVAARLLLDGLREEVFGQPVKHASMIGMYPQHLADMIETGIRHDKLNPRMGQVFNLGRLGKAIVGERDMQFSYVGLQNLYDRYLIKIKGDGGDRRIEMPQTFLMRVAMGLALDEDDPTARAIEFYNLLSTFRFMSSTPTLFNSGTRFSQLSSCYLSTVPDDLEEIYDAVKENALLAKYAGGLGNDWTPVRAQGSYIKGTGGNSQGIVPFLRVVNDTAVAVNQGGKRKGAVCCYLETWHRDITDFIELRKNTGDERRRTHDMNTANWIPDLFIKRVLADADWTLFSPADVPDLHDLYGLEFERAYEGYERRAAAGEIPHERIGAQELWVRMIKMIYETGHPWLTFKDACNIRSPQQHAGVVHSSNLCTEITLNTSREEIAVCNLGSVNLLAHMRAGRLDGEMIADTVRTAIRMLDNVIDLNYYSVDKARDSNMRHRPIGLGMMGFQDCLYEAGIGYDSQAAVEFADRSAELVAYHAYWASSDLAAERGRYDSYEGSLWSRGILPPDTLSLLAAERNGGEKPKVNGAIDSPYLQIDMSSQLDWQRLRAKIAADGMRNSNCLAIAPTATIANIVGVTASIEPTYQNLFTKSNLSGEFKTINTRLVRDLQKLGLWDALMISQIKQHDGEIDNIERIPDNIRSRYVTAFNIDQKWLIEAAGRRQKWIDQAQSLNLYVANPRGRDIAALYTLAWQRGLKTTYYLRSIQASSTEKYSTHATGNMNAVKVPPASACSIDDPECESCAG